jgi:hypothetical protein
MRPTLAAWRAASTIRWALARSTSTEAPWTPTSACTNEPDSIGQPVSSGCIRLLNHDIIDLYNRAPVGTPVIVVQAGWRPGAYAEDDQAAPPPVRVAGPVSEDGYWPPYGEGAYGYPPYSYKDVY